MPTPSRILAALLVSGVLLPAAGCASTKIWAKETLLGQQKREQLVSSVEAARDQQEEAKETFSSALDELLAISEGAGATAELESQYRKIESAFKKSESKAGAVNARIEAVERVAGALFKEWGNELEQYSSADLRRASERQLEGTREQYNQLLAAMKQAASKMDPVLAALKDQTLFLKHNLNAQAIASLRTDLQSISVDVASLIEEMEEAIAEADTFINAIRKD